MIPLFVDCPIWGRVRNPMLCLVLMLGGFAACAQTPRAPAPLATLTVLGGEAPGDSGSLTIGFNGFVETVKYGQFSSQASLAAGLAAMFCHDYLGMGLYAKAGASGTALNVITFQLVSGSFGSLNIAGPGTSFSFAASGFGGSVSSADTGTATLWFDGAAIATASYGEGSTGGSIAQDLALTAKSQYVTVTAEGKKLYLQSKRAGSYSDPFSVTFSTSLSFSSAPASGTLSSASGDPSPVSVYRYNAVYDLAGNVSGTADSVMGTWAYASPGYDSLNRLTNGQAFTGPYAGEYTCWSYDAFGNRLSQSVSKTPCGSSPPATYAATYAANNRIASVSAPANVTVSYDGAGNVTGDGYYSYLYDAEGRICAVHGVSGMVGYQYDADGRRIGKGMIATMSCDITSNGYSPMTDYVLDQSGGQMTEVAVAVNNGTVTQAWSHTNVTANGMLIATYDTTGTGLHFYIDDPLGSRRVQTDAAGFPEQTCQSLPFGDQLSCTGSINSPTEHHFTGKERDTESGNDYFGARYYASSMGRFMSPDWSAKVEPVPYSKLDDPQTLNLYAYARNNPLGGVDPDGHYFVVSAQDQKFYQQALADLYRRPGGRELVNSLANSDRPVLLDRHSFDTEHTGTAGQATALTLSGQSGVAGVHVSVGTDADLAAGARMAPGQVSSDVTTGHELEHANDGITAGQNSLQAGAAAMAAGDAPTSPGANNTVGGTAQARAEGIMGEKTDMSKKDAGAAVSDILKSGQQQWQNNADKSNICSQNQGACH